MVAIVDGDVRYRGRPDGYPVEKAVTVPESPDAIVLLRYWSDGAPKHFANVVRVAPDGSIRWRRMPPTHDEVAEDAWAYMRWDKQRGLTANSWSCFYCRIDAATGEITSAEFTK